MKRRDIVVIGFALTLVVLIGGGVLGYVSARRLAENRRMVVHTHQVIEQAQAALSTLKDAETGQRGYLLTDDAKYLAPYLDAVARVHGDLDMLRRLTTDNPAQAARVDDLDRKVTLKLAELARTIALTQSGDRAGAQKLVVTNDGMVLMDAVRADVAAMEQGEQTLLRQRSEIAERQYRITQVLIVLPALIGVALVAVIFYLSQRNARRLKRSAQIIAEQAERLRTTLASIGDGVIATDTRGCITMMNAVAEQLTGWTISEAQGQPHEAIFRIINHDSRQTVPSPVTRALRDGVIVGLANHTLLIAKDGSERAIDDSAAPIRCKEGQLVGCVLVFRDITDHRQIDSARQAATRELRETLDTAAVGLTRCSKDMKFVAANAAYAKLIGLPVEQIVGHTIADVMGNEGFALIRPQIERVLRGERVEFDIELPLSDAAPRWFSATYSPWIEDDGSINGWVASVADISQRKRAEMQFSELIERCPFGIYVVDSQFKIAHVNSRSQEGAFINVRPVIGRDFSEALRIIWPEEVAQEITAHFRRTAETGEPFYSKDFVRPRSDIDQVEGYEWELHRITIPDGHQGVVCYYYDSTQLRQAEAALEMARDAAEAANNAKDNFLATLSHELRTPLTPVLATLGLWEQSHTKELPAWMVEDVVTMRRNLELEARLIDDLLDLTRIVKGKINLNLEVLDLHDLIGSVIEICQSEIQAKKLELTPKLEASGCWVRGDAGRLQQALWNLIRNAAKFTPERGHISVRTRNDGEGRMQVIVEDDGVGISPQEMARLFQPFQQGEEQNVVRYGGLGLGLSITKTLLEAQQGSITAQSAGKGRGATFIITMPCADKPQMPRAPQEASARTGLQSAAPGRFGGLAATSPDKQDRCFRVLLVEDHRDTAQVLARLLRGNGHEVHIAESVRKALEANSTHRFDIVLSDIGLPDGTGIELIHQIRQQHLHKIPAIALTGFGMEDDVARCRAAGFDDHLTKPVNFVKLQQTLQRIGVDALGAECE